MLIQNTAEFVEKKLIQLFYEFSISAFIYQCMHIELDIHMYCRKGNKKIYPVLNHFAGHSSEYF